MEFETVFEYRHKKFGKRNRSADEESESAMKFTASEPLDQIEAKRPKIKASFEDKKFMAEVQLEPVNLSPRYRSKHDTKEEIKIIDHSAYSQTDITTDSMIMVTPKKEEIAIIPNRNYRITSTPSTSTESSSSAEEVQVKIEPPSTPHPTRVLTRRTARRTRSQATNRSQESTVSSPPTADLISVKIKEELIEINTSIKEKIPEETFEDICRFHENMVRSFPKKDRSPKEQDRRNKNTVACRKSRRVRKLSAALEETEYKNKYALYKDQMREYFILEKYSQFIMALSKRESPVIVVD